MVQLVTRRSALVLYGVLLVLPTVVLGGLLWRQIEKDHRALMMAVPGDTTDAVRRLADALEERVEGLKARENRRPFYEYKKAYFPPGTIGSDLAFVPSPLATGPAPEGILAWFCYSVSRRTGLEVEVFSGGHDEEPGWNERADDLSRATEELARHDLQESKDNIFSYLSRLGSVRIDPLQLPVAAVNASQEEDIECLKSELPALRRYQTETHAIQIFSFHLRFYRGADGTPRIVATRWVNIDANEHMRDMPSCFENLEKGRQIVQGFFIDPRWLFESLPSTLASTILDPSQQFFTAGATEDSLARRPRLGNGGIQAEVRPVKELGFETYSPEDEEYGLLRVVVNTRDLDDRFHSQTLHFLGVAAMLVLSLSTGLALLLRSVRRDLEAAQRTENFVAAVTHELRTPLSAIRMHGEMLQDGWIKDETKRREYYRRILRETGRLETLVERVLEKSRLSTSDSRPEPDDLNALVEGLGPALLGAGTDHPARDVIFELAPNLPAALVVPEGVRSIVTNLVENARKYAPVREANNGDAGGEPIRVATLASEGKPVLEVCDRGPGIPRDERTHVFDAFYRIGNETTRTTKGTGLGLHLVALHCAAMDAKVQVLDRDGGGTVFRVTFERAREDTARVHEG